MKKHQNPPRDYTIRKIANGPLGGLYVELTGARSLADNRWYIENEAPEFFGLRIVAFAGDDGASLIAPRYDSYPEALEAAKALATQLSASLDDRYDREHPWQPGEWEQALTSAAE